jgi:VanZ family protein
MKKTIINSVIGLIFSALSFIGYTVFATSQQNKIDSVIQKNNITNLSNHVEVLTASINDYTGNINKRIDQLNDTIVCFQKSNVNEHNILVTSNKKVIRYLRITDSRFKQLFNDLAINQ